MKFKRFLNEKFAFAFWRREEDSIAKRRDGTGVDGGTVKYIKKSQEGQWTSAFVTLFPRFNMLSWKFTRCTYVFNSAISCAHKSPSSDWHKLIWIECNFTQFCCMQIVVHRKPRMNEEEYNSAFNDDRDEMKWYDITAVCRWKRKIDEKERWSSAYLHWVVFLFPSSSHFVDVHFFLSLQTFWYQ